MEINKGVKNVGVENVLSRVIYHSMYLITNIYQYTVTST